MNYNCPTCNLSFTTCSNLRKHERTEKHLAKCQLIVKEDSKSISLEQKVKELEEKLERSQYENNLKDQLILSYQSIIAKFSLQPVEQPVEQPVKKVKKTKPVVEPVVEPVVDPVVEPVVEPKKKKEKKQKTDEEEIEVLKNVWDTFQERFDFKTGLEEIESYQAPNEVLENFKQQYLARFVTYYMDCRVPETIDPIPTPEPTPEPVSEPTLELVKPRRKLKIIQDPPKNN